MILKGKMQVTTASVSAQREEHGSMTNRATASLDPRATTLKPQASGASSTAKRQRTRRPPELPQGDSRFHPYQKHKLGLEFLGCRVCVCDKCGWQATWNTQILPWQGAFVHTDELREYFKHEGKQYSSASVKEYYEQGEIDVTWYCLWCVVRHDTLQRSWEHICKDYYLYSENA